MHLASLMPHKYEKIPGLLHSLHNWKWCGPGNKVSSLAIQAISVVTNLSAHLVQNCQSPVSFQTDVRAGQMSCHLALLVTIQHVWSTCSSDNISIGVLVVLGGTARNMILAHKFLPRVRGLIWYCVRKWSGRGLVGGRHWREGGKSWRMGGRDNGSEGRKETGEGVKERV